MLVPLWRCDDCGEETTNIAGHFPQPASMMMHCYRPCEIARYVEETHSNESPEEERVRYVPCRKCGKDIDGLAFGSPATGWEHPFTCPS